MRHPATPALSGGFAGAVGGGDLLAAPFAAVLCSRIPRRVLMTIVWLVTSLLSVCNLGRAFT
jgi:hypothetical protein